MDVKLPSLNSSSGRSSSPSSSVVEDTHRTLTGSQGNSGPVDTNVPFNEGASNLQADQSEESEALVITKFDPEPPAVSSLLDPSSEDSSGIGIEFVAPGPGPKPGSDSDSVLPAADTSLLTQAELAAFKKDAIAFANSLTELSAEQHASLPDSSRPASKGEVVPGVVLGGIAGYSAMWVAAQVISKLVNVYSPLAGAVSFPIVTALLRALIPEPGAGMRRDHDGKAVELYVTALAEWIAAKLEGDPAKEMIYEKAMKDVVASVIKRMDKDPELSPAFKDNPMLGAYLRDLVTKLSILSFGIAFTISGSAQPFIRQFCGSEPILSAVADIAASASAGFLGGAGTAFFANLLRDKVQHAPPARVLLSKDGGAAMQARIDAKLDLLKENDAKLRQIEILVYDKLIVSNLNTQKKQVMERLLAIKNARLQIRKASDNLSEMSQRLSSPAFRKQLAVEPTKLQPTWAQGWPSKRQAMATGLGVALALSYPAYLMYEFEMRLNSGLPLDRNDTAGGLESVAGGINAMVGYSIGVAWATVGAFAVHKFISHPLQLGMGALAGLGRRAGIWGGDTEEVQQGLDITSRPVVKPADPSVTSRPVKSADPDQKPRRKKSEIPKPIEAPPKPKDNVLPDDVTIDMSDLDPPLRDSQKPAQLQFPPLEALVSEPGGKHTESLLANVARDLGSDMRKINRALERLDTIHDDTDPSIVGEIVDELNRALDDELGHISNELPEVADIDQLLAEYDADNPT